MKIKAIAVDIDGTLTDDLRKLSPAALQSLGRLHVPLVIATGNTHCFTRAATIMLGASHSIAENGGVISIDDHMEIIADRRPCDEAYSQLAQEFSVELLDARYRLTDLVLRRGFDLKAASAFIERTGIPVDLVDTGFAVHIKNKGISKGAALLRVASRMGLDPRAFAAVGDSLSDIPMMEEAGFVAAVANAVPQVKEIADYVSPSPYGEGFAEVVEYMASRGMI